MKSCSKCILAIVCWFFCAQALKANDDINHENRDFCELSLAVYRICVEQDPVVLVFLRNNSSEPLIMPLAMERYSVSGKLGLIYFSYGYGPPLWLEDVIYPYSSSLNISIPPGGTLLWYRGSLSAEYMKDGGEIVSFEYAIYPEFGKQYGLPAASPCYLSIALEIKRDEKGQFPAMGLWVAGFMEQQISKKVRWKNQGRQVDYTVR